MEEYGINPTKWYSPNDIRDDGLLFGKSKRYIFEVIKSGKLKATDTSETQKPQWKILGKDLIEFIKNIEGGNNEDSTTTDEGV